MEPFLQLRNGWMLNVRELDNQHKQIVDNINNINQLYLVQNSTRHDQRFREKMVDLLDLLYAESKQHFSDEEKFMFKSGYPHYTAHAEEHAMLLAELKSCRNSIRDGKEELDLRLLINLRSWMVSHLMDDKDFASHLLESKSGKPVAAPGRR